jgi:sarcosine oxidase
MSNHFDTIVIGVGGMGSATCFELARRGRRVLGLEQFDIPHTRGSSHGVNRIIRLAYYEHPSYVPLLRRAYELFHELEARCGEQLLHYTGSVDAGPADSEVFNGALHSAQLCDLPHEVLDGAELTHRFPGYQFPHDHMALFQPQGGFLMSERCIVQFAHAAMNLGAEIHGREKVLEYAATSSGGVRVRTDRGEYFADSLVITAGAWDSQLLPHLRGLAVPERQVLAWLRPTRPEHFRIGTFPVFNALVEEGRYYGFPEFGIPGFKFGRYHHFEETGHPDTLTRGERGEPRPDDEAVLREFAARYFPDGCGPTLSLAACMFTNTPDGHFIIDRHPDLPQVIYASPCSGHGFKFTAVLGEVLAELAISGATRHDIDFFRFDRFDHVNLKSEIW